MCLNLSYSDNSERQQYPVHKFAFTTARCADLFESSLSDRAYNKLKSHEVALMYKKNSKRNTRLSFTRETKKKLLFATLLYRRLDQCIARFLAKIVVAKLLKLQ